MTADAPNDPLDQVSPHAGEFSDNPLWDDTDPSSSPNGEHPGHGGNLDGYSTCQGVFPYPDPIIFGGLLDRVQNGHAGYPVASLLNDCAGQG